MRISDWSSDVCSSDPLLPVVYQRKSVWQRSQDGKLRSRTHPVNDCVGPAACRKRERRAETIGEILLLALQKRRVGSESFFDAFLQRSEEHTSELQSLMRISYAVFCLKKKKHKRSGTQT